MNDEGRTAAEMTAEELEAVRLADALDAIERGETPGVDPREDPALAGLLQMAGMLNASLDEAASTPGFQSYRRRSREVVLHAAEPRRLEPAPRVLPFWRRAFPVLAPVAAAAAAAAITFFAIEGGTLQDSGRDAGSPLRVSYVGTASDSVVGLNEVGIAGRPDAATELENLTPRTIEQQLNRLQASLVQIAEHARSGEPVDSLLLRLVTEDTADLKRRIEEQPGAVDGQTVMTYVTTAATGKELLNTVQAKEGSEGALVAARLATQDGVDSAKRYFGENPDQLPPDTNTPTATPDAAADATAPADSSDPADDGADVTTTGTPEPTATATPSPDG